MSRRNRVMPAVACCNHGAKAVVAAPYPVTYLNADDKVVGTTAQWASIAW